MPLLTSFSTKRIIAMVVAAIVTFTSIIIAVRADENHTDIFLPGTQPMSVGLDNVQTCQQCHGSPLRPDVRIYPDWSGSMMAHSARDPIFYAALAVSNKFREADAPGEFCLRCHAPAGWLSGHSEDFTGRSIVGTDLDGITCDYCHRTVDPMNPDTTVPTLSIKVPGYGNAMHVIQKAYEPKRGPFSYPYMYPDSSSFSPPHRAMLASFIESGNLCGICHDVSNPFNVTQDQKQHLPPYAYAPAERTFSEWAVSSFGQMGEDGSCQHCHMADTSGYACVYAHAPNRDAMGRHDLTGGNTFVPDILADFWNLDSNKVRTLGEAKQRTVQTLQRAADLHVDAVRLGDSVVANVRVTNLTGHKLPTGYPLGRRMWLSIEATDSNGNSVFHSGRYDTATAIIESDGQLKIYRAIHGMTDTTAQRFHLPAGPSFHFIINDSIIYDNRIPPMGFTNEAFNERLAMPVGVTYADSQYWDDTRYTLPKNTAHISVTLLYQTISKEYIDFLRNENLVNSFDWGRYGTRLDSVWNLRGKSRPVVMNDVKIDVRDSIFTSVNDGPKPVTFALEQNYPNPFNPSTTIRYAIPTLSRVSVIVYNTLGMAVATLIDRTQPSGKYETHFDATNMPSGMYFVRVQAGAFSATRKMLLVR